MFSPDVYMYVCGDDSNGIAIAIFKPAGVRPPAPPMPPPPPYGLVKRSSVEQRHGMLCKSRRIPQHLCRHRRLPPLRRDSGDGSRGFLMHTWTRWRKRMFECPDWSECPSCHGLSFGSGCY